MSRINQNKISYSQTTFMEISNHLNENLRFLRKKMNLSQEEFANKVGLNRGNTLSTPSPWDIFLTVKLEFTELFFLAIHIPSNA